VLHHIQHEVQSLLGRNEFKRSGKVKKQLRSLCRLVKAMGKDPSVFTQVVNTVPSCCSAYGFSRSYTDTVHPAADSVASSTNPLWEYFQNHHEGHGIVKWEHYFDIYHRHFARFIGHQVNVLEIGIYRGGSLEMWRSYFGEQSHIYGVDIEPACKAFEADHISVLIGDQADRTFWSSFRKSVEGIDILIDDGGHTPEQQQITLEEMLPNLRPGGVYLCEDVHGCFNRFSAFAAGLVHDLNGLKHIPGSQLESSLSPFQSSIHSIHFYPYLVVIEKHRVPPAKLLASKRGSGW
jgi:hypothetical protein